MAPVRDDLRAVSERLRRMESQITDISARLTGDLSRTVPLGVLYWKLVFVLLIGLGTVWDCFGTVLCRGVAVR